MLWLFVGSTKVYLLDFFCSGIQFYSVLSPYLCFISLLYLDCVKYFTDFSKALLLLWIFYVFFSVLCLLCLCVCLFICALWSPAGKGLTFWL